MANASITITGRSPERMEKPRPDLTNEEIMSLLVYVASRTHATMTVGMLSEMLVEARRQHLYTGSIPIRPIPNGYYSEYLAEHAALLTEAGLAQKINPLVMTREGTRLLEETIREIKERNPQQAKAWLDFPRASS